MPAPVAIITLCGQGAAIARQIAQALGACDIYVHESVDGYESSKTFERVVDLSAEIFDSFDGVIYIMPAGVVVRAIAPLIQHKTTDPAVVAVDVGGRWAVSLLSGHEGGANTLAMRVANAIDAEPVISTTTEAAKTVIAGVGCRRGTSAEAIIAALQDSLKRIERSVDDLRMIASVDIKSDEPGLLQAAKQLGIPLRFISSREIGESGRDFEHSAFVQEKVNLPAVAEPAALLAGRRTKLLLQKQKYENVTVAIAVENCLWSE